MKKIFLVVIMGFMAMVPFADAQTLEIEQENIDISVGESIQISAIYTNAQGEPEGVDISWKVAPKKLGVVNTNDLFVAESKGKGYLYARYDGLVDSIKVNVKANDSDDDEEETDDDEENEDEDGEDDDKGKDDHLPKIQIFPHKVEIDVDSTEQLSAIYIDEQGDTLDVEFSWWVVPGFIGSIDMNTIFTAAYPGNGKIYAQYGKTKTFIKVNVDGEKEDDDDDDDDDEPAHVKIVTRKIEIAPQDSVQLLAVFKDSLGNTIDTTFTWSIEPADLGFFKDSASGLFFADKEGKGKIIAAVGELADTVKVEIESKEEEEQEPGNNEEQGKGPLVISPLDTVVNIGESIQFSATHRSKEQGRDLQIEWFLLGDAVGEINAEGVFTATSAGVGVIRAKSDPFEGMTTITVVDPENSDGELNTITIHRVLPDGHILPPHEVMEGSVFVIGGLPFPLNVLNGGRLYFPIGCLHEDINIHMLLPNNIEVKDDTVTSVDGSVAAIRFDVSVGDSSVSPYYFDIPLNLSIPFKLDLLEELGIDPGTLDLFYENNSGFTNAGISNVTVDSLNNQILAQVVHFSTLVVREQEMSSGFETNDNVIPENFQLEQNYPNPFNPSTTIQYQLQQSGQVLINVYDSLGKWVTTLVDRNAASGSHKVVWNGKNDKGMNVASGIYFYSFSVNGNTLDNKKMLLLK